MEFSSEDTYRTRYIQVPHSFPCNFAEVHAETGAWRLASYIREGSQSGQISEHISALRLTKGAKISSLLKPLTRLRELSRENIIIKNEATVDIGRSSYKAIYDVIYQAEKASGLLWKSSALGDNEKIAKIGEEAEGRYMLETAIKYGQRMILEANGPTIMARLSSKIANMQANITTQ
ncbi:vitellogenin [Penaeus vannamei]|uniref:Vitellogenin n=1 Tax=Penaeus vannamei TaxID=6689 RepID=A0A3R7NE73_PENVA|nr:vitellogenin [Penaeus vannamei]